MAAQPLLQGAAAPAAALPRRRCASCPTRGCCTGLLPRRRRPAELPQPPRTFLALLANLSVLCVSSACVEAGVMVHTTAILAPWPARVPERGVEGRPLELQASLGQQGLLARPERAHPQLGAGLDARASPGL